MDGQRSENCTHQKLSVAAIEKQQADQYYPYHLYEQTELELLVYQLYDLTDDDVREIELWYCRRYSRLAEAQGVMQQVHEKYADHLARANRILEKPPAYWLSHPILTRIGEEDEGQTFELKETLEVNAQGNQEPATALKTLKTVAAFLNTDGGTLLIGVSDDGNIRGLDADLQYCSNKNVDGFKLKLRDMLKSRLAPDPRDEVSIEIEYLPEGAICRVEVQPRSDITLVDNDFVYIRVGNRTERLNGPDKLKWAQKRGAAQALKSTPFNPSS